MKKVILFLLVLILNSHEVSAASASGTGTIAARIVAAVSVDETKTLKFGTMTGDAGVVSIGLTGDRTSTGANLVEDSTNPPSNGEMLIYGPINQVVYIGSISDTTVTSGSASMSVSNFQTDQTGVVTLTSVDGTPVKIGAKLNVLNSQPEGDYTGSYTLTVTY